MNGEWFSLQWPVIDSPNRLEAFVVKAIWSPPLSQSGVDDPEQWQRALAFDLEFAADSALKATLARVDIPRQEAEEIATGPEVEGEILSFFLTIWGNRPEIADHLLPLIRVAITAEFLGRLVKDFRERADQGLQTGRPHCEISFSPYALALACEWQISQVFGEVGPFSVKIDPDAKGLSSERPDERLQYQVDIKGKDEHSFLLTSTGKVLKYLRNGDQETIDQWSNSIIPNVDDWPVQMPVGTNWRTGEIEKHWPTQDGLDRSGTIAFLIAGPYDINQPVATGGPVLEKFTQEAIYEVLGNQTPFVPTAQYYQVGPAAGGIDQFIITLFNSREELAALIGFAADAWAVSEIARRVYRRVRNHFQQVSEEATLYFPVETLILFCEDYIRRNYHPRARLNSEWYCLTQQFYGGYSSPGHPTPSVEYLIVVETTKKKYQFRIIGSGEVKSFSMHEGQRIFNLEVPKILEDNAGE